MAAQVIRITLRGSPGLRTGTAEIDGQTWQLVTWHKQSGGEVHATTSDGERVTLALDAGNGGITVGKRFWFIRSAAWVNTTMTGDAMPGVSDPEMAQMMPGCGWC